MVKLRVPPVKSNHPLALRQNSVKATEVSRKQLFGFLCHKKETGKDFHNAGPGHQLGGNAAANALLVQRVHLRILRRDRVAQNCNHDDADHRDERDQQRVFDERCTLFVRNESARSRDDAFHITPRKKRRRILPSAAGVVDVNCVLTRRIKSESLRPAAPHEATLA
jgi:hypothetical protein